MTDQFSHIACCIDHSDASMQALDQAIRLQATGDGRLSLLHVGPWPMDQGESGAIGVSRSARVVYLDDMRAISAGHGAARVPNPAVIMAGAREWLDGVVAAHPGTEGVLLDGYPPEAACDWAADAGVDLLVASSSLPLFDRVLLGSFAGYLARHAPCAVLLTRPGAVDEEQRHEAQAGAREDAERGSPE
jgi:nucleotide-binding universal stress UspA family protein